MSIYTKTFILILSAMFFGCDKREISDEVRFFSGDCVSVKRVATRMAYIDVLPHSISFGGWNEKWKVSVGGDNIPLWVGKNDPIIVNSVNGNLYVVEEVFSVDFEGGKEIEPFNLFVLESGKWVIIDKNKFPIEIAVQNNWSNVWARNPVVNNEYIYRLNPYEVSFQYSSTARLWYYLDGKKMASSLASPDVLEEFQRKNNVIAPTARCNGVRDQIPSSK